VERGNPSRTAIFAAIHRAAHYLIDDSPKILADRFARPFAGFASDQELMTALNDLPYPDFPGHRALFTLRSRYTEDELAAAAQSGISQYIILGAGLDSYPYRRPDAMCALQVYEVDHPSSQAWKRARLSELGIEAPPTLHYVPVDFEHETLTAGLTVGGIDRKARAFFSWLGVTQYLTRDAVARALREIASAAAPGSELVASFAVPAGALDQEGAELLTAVAGRAASVGEPWLSFFEPEEMRALLLRVGYEDVALFGPEQAAERYLLGRRDGLRMPAYSRLINARIG
jgi:methyltransferase (TIGR00027 family)